jgi:phosphoglycolate phosphatase-like HAD superfamily hydrolase
MIWVDKFWAATHVITDGLELGKEKYTYETHMQRIRDRVEEIQTTYENVKKAFIDLDLLMEKMNRLLNEIEKEGLEVEIVTKKQNDSD